MNSDVPKIEIRMNAAGNLPTWQFPVSVYVDGMYLDLAPETGSGAFREFTSKNTDWNFTDKPTKFCHFIIKLFDLIISQLIISFLILLKLDNDGSRSYVVIGDMERTHLTVVLPTGMSVQATTVENTVTFALALPSKYIVTIA